MPAEETGPRVRQSGNRVFILLFSLLFSFPVVAQDSVGTVLERMKSTTATRLAYQETRYLELLEKPVKGSGYFYAMPPSLLIKEQTQPNYEIMAIRGNRLYYLNSDRGLHHIQDANNEDPIYIQLGAFLALVNGNRALMDALYRVSFVSEPGYWYMILMDKKNDEPLVRITVSGPTGQVADKFEIHQADGDRVVYTLKMDGEGDAVKASILELEAKLTGH